MTHRSKQIIGFILKHSHSVNEVRDFLNALNAKTLPLPSIHCLTSPFNRYKHPPNYTILPTFASMYAPYAFVNQELVASQSATLPINDLAILRGYGLFDFFRIQQGKPLYFNLHWNRLLQSAQIMQLKIPFDDATCLEMIEALYQKCKVVHGGIRITITGGCSVDGYLPNGTPQSIITMQSLPTLPDTLPATNLALMTVPYQRPIPFAKTIDYTMGIYYQMQLATTGFNDVLYHHNHFISECPRSNVFVLYPEGVLATPQEGILKGITRHRLLKLASQFCLVEERAIHLNQLFRAAAVFVTSTTKGIWQVSSIDGQTVGNATGLSFVQQLYDCLLKEDREFGG